MMTGTAGSETKVSWTLEVTVKLPSTTVKVTAELVSVFGVPEISPVTGSRVSPDGRFIALILAEGLPPVVVTWKLKGLSTRPVALVLLVMTGPDVGAGCTVRDSVTLAVPLLFEALSPT